MECLEKPTLVLNNKLLLFFLPDLCDIRQKWLRDIPDLDDEDWEDVWDFPFRQLVSFRDTLTIQNIAQSLLHPIQTTQNGLIILPGVLAVWLLTWWFYTFFAPSLPSTGRKGISIINTIAKLSIVPTVSLCLLGLVEELVPTVAERSMLSLHFFYAHKAITMSWKKAAFPSPQFWKHLVNVNLTLCKETYANMGCLKKYSKV